MFMCMISGNCESFVGRAIQMVSM